MARITIHLPDDLDERVRDRLEYGDSYSAVVQAALTRHLDRTNTE